MQACSKNRLSVTHQPQRLQRGLYALAGPRAHTRAAACTHGVTCRSMREARLYVKQGGMTVENES